MTRYLLLPTAVPWGLVYWRRVLVGALLGMLGGGALGAWGATTTLPMASRPDALCQALGTEAPCATEEIGHLRGTVLLVAQETTDMVGLFLVKGVVIAAPLGPADEGALLGALGHATAAWAQLVPPSVTWPTLRALARVSEGVPVVQTVTAARGPWDGQDDGMATTGPLRVRVALVRLR